MRAMVFCFGGFVLGMIGIIMACGAGVGGFALVLTELDTPISGRAFIGIACGAGFVVGILLACAAEHPDLLAALVAADPVADAP